MTLRDIATLVGAQWEEGSPSPEIFGVASVGEAGEGDISFFYNPKYIAQLRSTRATAVLVPTEFSEEISAIALRVNDPAEAFKKVLAHFAPLPVEYPRTIHSSAIIAPTACLGESVHIGALVVIEDGAKIGDHSTICAGSYIGHGASVGESCHIAPRVSILASTKIANRVIIHSGVVLGGDGFGYESSPAGHKKIPQTGIVQIDDDVEIGANTTIDRARFGRTWIKRGTKIDNLCQIGHNVIIGENSILCGQVGVSGSARIGSWVILAGQVGVSGHIEIGDGATLGPQAGVPKSIPAGQKFIGSPARPMREFAESVVRVSNLKKTEGRIATLEKTRTS